MDYCGQCGAKLGPDQAFCHKCGALLSDQRVVGDEGSAPAGRPIQRAVPWRDSATFTPRGSSMPRAQEGHPSARTTGLVPMRATRGTRPRRRIKDMTRREWVFAIVVAVPLGVWGAWAIGGGASTAGSPAPVAAMVTSTPVGVASHAADSSQAPAAVAIQSSATATDVSQPTDTALPTVSPADMAAMKAQVTGAHICKGADYGGSMPLCGKDASSLSQADIDGGAGVSFAAPAHEPNDRFPAGSYTLTVYEIDATNTPNQIGTMPLNMQSGNGYVGWKLSDVVSIAGLTLIPDTTYELELDGPVVMGVAGQARFSYAGDGTASANALPTSDSSLASDEGGTGPTAECNDGTTSYSAHPSGTCSYHGGVAVWDDHLQHSTP